MAIQVIAHPPERAARSLPLLCAVCGCCCCCCCIHTAGGIVGALVGNGASSPPIPAAGEENSLTPTIDVNRAYWRTVGLLSLITLIGGVGIFGIVIILVFLPVIQLVAAAITALRLGGAPGWKWQQLARMTGFSLLGSGLGVVVTLFLLAHK